MTGALAPFSYLVCNNNAHLTNNLRLYNLIYLQKYNSNVTTRGQYYKTFYERKYTRLMFVGKAKTYPSVAHPLTSEY